MSTETLEYYKTKEKNMRIKDLIEQLSTYEENSEVIIYDDDNDREYKLQLLTRMKAMNLIMIRRL